MILLPSVHTVWRRKTWTNNHKSFFSTRVFLNSRSNVYNWRLVFLHRETVFTSKIGISHHLPARNSSRYNQIHNVRLLQSLDKALTFSVRTQSEWHVFILITLLRNVISINTLFFVLCAWVVRARWSYWEEKKMKNNQNRVFTTKSKLSHDFQQCHISCLSWYLTLCLFPVMFHIAINTTMKSRFPIMLHKNNSYHDNRHSKNPVA